jgi:excisionase family DNA binding protein
LITSRDERQTEITVLDKVDDSAATSADLLTADDVIDRLLADANLRRVAATCVLPAVRVGSAWRFRRSDLDEWIRQQRQ